MSNGDLDELSVNTIRALCLDAVRYEVLPPSVKARPAIEQASTLGWGRCAGDGGAVVGMYTFGASTPPKELAPKLGFAPEKVMEVARKRGATAKEQR